jgi:hypothetical protein
VDQRTPVVADQAVAEVVWVLKPTQINTVLREMEVFLAGEVVLVDIALAAAMAETLVAEEELVTTAMEATTAS